MSKLIIPIILLVILVGGVFIYQSGSDSKIMKTNTLKLTSTAFAHNGDIPEKYTCDGQNFNPPLAISGVPPEAKSLALIVHDPDAPSPPAGGDGWDH